MAGHRDILDAELLRTFVTIVDHGGFTAAAPVVLRTPSAVSMQIKRLEEAIGRPLFARDGRAATLTREGEVLLGYARRILRLHQEALARFREPEVSGSVRIGTPDDYATMFLPAVLARFSRTHCCVRVEVQCAPSAELERRVGRGEVDLALVSVRGEPGPGGEVVFREGLIWIGAAGGTAHLETPLPLAAADEECAWRRAALSALDAAAIEWRIAYSSPNYSALHGAVVAGLAIAAAPASALGPGLRRLGAADGLPPLPDYRVELRVTEAASPAAMALADAIRDAFTSRPVQAVA